MRWLEKFWHKTLRRPYKLVKAIEKGTGQPVLLIHGLGANGKAWNPLVRLMNHRKWRILAYDLLGFGASPKPEFLDYNVEEHARSLLVSVDSGYKKQGLVLIGHSMGCLVASHIAWKHPEIVKRLILYEPPLFADSPEFRSHKRRRRLYFALYKELLKRPRIFFTYNKIALRYAERRALGLDIKTWPAFEKSLLNTVMSQRAYDELIHTKVPTDIIYGRFDFIVTRTDVKKMLQANPNVSFHLVREMHEITPRAGRYINKLLEAPPQSVISYTKKNAKK